MNHENTSISHKIALLSLPLRGKKEINVCATRPVIFNVSLRCAPVKAH
jgi:hypothetical protein